jgi:hypothetical protein
MNHCIRAMIRFVKAKVRQLNMDDSIGRLQGAIKWVRHDAEHHFAFTYKIRNLRSRFWRAIHGLHGWFDFNYCDSGSIKEIIL